MVVATLLCAIITILIEGGVLFPSSFTKAFINHGVTCTGVASQPLLKLLKIKTQADDEPTPDRPIPPKNLILRRIVVFYEALIDKYLIKKVLALIDIRLRSSSNDIFAPTVRRVSTFNDRT